MASCEVFETYRTFLGGGSQKSFSSFIAITSVGLFPGFSSGGDLERGGCSAVSCAMDRDWSS